MPLADLSTATLRSFPPVPSALDDNGLLAIGGDLSPQRLLAAYRQGIFPWFSDDDPILWWSPNPRMVLVPERAHVSRRLMRQVRRMPKLRISTDTAFEQIMRACAEPRSDQAGTWITEDMITAYSRLHAIEFAHSLEVWDGADLIGGIYGVSLGRMFFGESMFTRRDGGSKIALIGLCCLLQRQGVALMDCQMHTGHLQRMGGHSLPRARFLRLVKRLTSRLAKEEWRTDEQTIRPQAWLTFAETIRQREHTHAGRTTAR
jgi:leucyl/phenylalanyl-tRNA--protein transferase